MLVIILSQAVRGGGCNNLEAISPKIVNGFADCSEPGRKKIKNLGHRQLVKWHAHEVMQEVKSFIGAISPKGRMHMSRH